MKTEDGVTEGKEAEGKTDPPLVLVEWEDSSQPISHWQQVSDIKVSAVKIASVGWLLKDGKKVKALVPNVGGLGGRGSPQCSGVIAIPTRCVIRITKLEETDAPQPARPTRTMIIRASR